MTVARIAYRAGEGAMRRTHDKTNETRTFKPRPKSQQENQERPRPRTKKDHTWVGERGYRSAVVVASRRASPLFQRLGASQQRISGGTSQTDSDSHSHSHLYVSGCAREEDKHLQKTQNKPMATVRRGSFSTGMSRGASQVISFPQ